MKRVEVDGLKLAYERAGAGPPLVLLHGYVGDGPTTWRGQLDGLSDDFTVVAWDAPGAGSSDPPEGFGASVRAFHPAGFRAMARASAENLRDVLARIEVPTLLLYGDRDVRAPLPVAEDLQRWIPGARLVLLAGAGHASNIEAPEAFNKAVRGFLRDLPEGA